VEYVDTQIFESQTNRREEKNESSRVKSNSPVQSIHTLFFCDQKQEVIQDAVDCAKIVRRRFFALRFFFFPDVNACARGEREGQSVCVLAVSYDKERI
jgi:hypothetical protein